jgi:hypothetical protein
MKMYAEEEVTRSSTRDGIIQWNRRACDDEQMRFST